MTSRYFFFKMLKFRRKFKSNYLLGFALLILSISFVSYIFISHLMFTCKYSDIPTLSDDYIKNLKSDDPRLISHIRKNYLHPPTPRNISYHLNNPARRYWSQKTQSAFIEKLFNGKKNGFFIECGAYDGETYSNTLSLEVYLNWTGILIEPDYLNVKALLTKNRKSWILNGCLGDTEMPQKMILYGGSYVGALAKHMTIVRNMFTRYWQPMKAQEVWCFPMLSILLAVNTTKVDFLSLDVEGAEMDIIEAIPWRTMDVDVVQVEYMVFQGIYWDKDLSTSRRLEIQSFVSRKLPHLKLYAKVFHDLIFAKNVTMPRNI